MGNKLCIRTDGSQKIGLGHITRCITLAQILKKDFSMTFYCREIPSELIEVIEKNGFSFVKINSESDFLDNLNTNDGVILDGYDFDYSLQKLIKDRGCKLICIDDLVEREFYCDLIINHSPGISRADYKVPVFTKLALGTGYALLRPEFLGQIHATRSISKTEQVFVCFGGSDSPDLSYQISEILINHFTFDRINVIIGSAYTHTRIVELAKKHPELCIYRNIDANTMITIMTQSQLAIAPASGILLELFTIKMPVISGYYAANQERFYTYLNTNNIITGIGDFTKADTNSIIQAVHKVLNGNSNEIVNKQYSLMKNYQKNNINNIIKSLWHN
jgi:UDP-2,4-diacetamido-2,4,6-trideoxy-beta-L-altropyranose hydrolase